jgi:kynurenine formamidase
LIDYLGWAESQGIKYSPVEQHAVTVENLEKAAAAQNVTFKHGDILFVRSGFVKWYNESSDEERTKGMHRGQFTGIEGSQKTIEWVWNHHFAAVAGDASAYEVWPAPVPEYRLHDNLLALMGIPLGEMFDLETLTETCRKLNRWSFFVTSAPLNVKGGIASPPNALCIF